MSTQIYELYLIKIAKDEFKLSVKKQIGMNKLSEVDSLKVIEILESDMPRNKKYQAQMAIFNSYYQYKHDSISHISGNSQTTILDSIVRNWDNLKLKLKKPIPSNPGVSRVRMDGYTYNIQLKENWIERESISIHSSDSKYYPEIWGLVEILEALYEDNSKTMSTRD